MKKISASRRDAMSRYAFDVSKLALGGVVVTSFMKDEFFSIKALWGFAVALAFLITGYILTSKK